MRGIAIVVPVAAVVALGVWRPPGSLRLGAAIVATAWAGLTLLPVNLLALHLGWWAFAVEGAVWNGLPVDLWLGWALMWSAVPALAPRTVPPVALAAGLVWADLVLMPLGAPVVHLGENWLVGEGVAIAVVLVPAVALARWTLGRRHPELRGWAQAGCSAGLFLGLPIAVLDVEPAWPRPVITAGLQVVALACVPGVAAMRELARVGRGTPLPYDPPSRLVVSGPYAYAVVYAAGLAAWHEEEQLRAEYGKAWVRYRTAVPVWVPRWRPAAVEDAVLYVAGDREMCTGVGGWFADRRPVGLRLRPAAEHPELLWRLTYEAPGVHEQGIAAFARPPGVGVARVGARPARRASSRAALRRRFRGGASARTRAGLLTPVRTPADRLTAAPGVIRQSSARRSRQLTARGQRPSRRRRAHRPARRCVS